MEKLAMEIDAKLIAELWETVKDLIPASKRDDVALEFMSVFEDNDVEIHDMDALRGADDSLDSALDELYGDVDLDEDY
jgi:hypothetical protein